MKRLTAIVAFALALAAVAAAVRTAAAQEARREEARRQEAERSLHFSSAEGSLVEVDGDSTLHKWTVRGRQIDGTIDFFVDVPPGATAEQVVDAIVKNPRVAATASVPVRTLKSTKNDKGMDSKMYDALDSRKHPTISYELTEVTAVRRESPTRFAIDTRGNMTIAGTTRVLDTPMNVHMKSDRELEVEAKFGTLMSHFGVKPPQALGGMIKSHNKVVVTVRWSVAR